MNADPHKPLRDDVRRLGEVLGTVLREHEGDALYQHVERVRALAKAAHSGSEDAFETLAGDLSQLPVESALPLARAFAHFLNLANIAEQHHRIRRRRVHQADPEGRPQRGSCEDSFERLIASGIAPDRLHDAVCTLQVELVLTAHPTEISRRTLVEKHNRIAASLGARDRPDATPLELEEIDASLLREVMAAWGTEEVRPERPSVLDEVRAGLIVFEQSLWQAMPRYLREVDRALRTRTRPWPPRRRVADPLRVVDRRRPRRQSERHARRHASDVPAASLDGGGPVSARDRGAPLGTVDERRLARAA